MKPRSAAGSTLVETILLVLILLVPLIWMLGALARVHRAALGVTAAAREAGAAAASAGDPAAAVRLADHSAGTALRNQALAPRRARVELRGVSSFGRGARIEARVVYPVRMLHIPFVASAVGPVVWVRASHAAYVDRYRSFP